MSVFRHIIMDLKLFASILYLQGLKKHWDTSYRSCYFVLCDELPRASRASHRSRAWEVLGVAHRTKRSIRWHLQKKHAEVSKSLLGPYLHLLPCSLSFALQCLQTQEEAVTICSSLPHRCDEVPVHALLCTGAERSALGARAYPLQAGLRGSPPLQDISMARLSLAGSTGSSFYFDYQNATWKGETGQYSKEESHKCCIASLHIHSLTLHLSFLLFCNHHINKGIFPSTAVHIFYFMLQWA